MQSYRFTTDSEHYYDVSCGTTFPSPLTPPPTNSYLSLLLPRPSSLLGIFLWPLLVISFILINDNLIYSFIIPSLRLLKIISYVFKIHFFYCLHHFFYVLVKTFPSYNFPRRLETILPSRSFYFMFSSRPSKTIEKSQ